MRKRRCHTEPGLESARSPNHPTVLRAIHAGEELSRMAISPAEASKVSGLGRGLLPVLKTPS